MLRGSFVLLTLGHVMKRMLPVALILVVSSFCCAQNTGSAAPSQNPSPSASIPAQPAPTAAQQSRQAALIPVQLSKSIDSRKVKQGDPVEAKIAAKLRTGDAR